MSILWMFAAFQVLSTVVYAFSIGKPKTKTTYTPTEMYVSAGMCLLMVYALVLVSVA